MHHHRSVLTVLAATLAVFVGTLSGGIRVAAAQSDDLTLPTSTVITGDPGDVVELGRLPVDMSLAGPLCTWTATVRNQSSTHPDSDVLVESNGTTLVVSDVEGTPNKVSSNSGSVSLASEVVVSIRLGPDGLFSGGLDLTISYSSCGPTTTVAVATTTVADVTTTADVSTTSEPPQTTPTTSEPATTTAPEPSTADTQVAGPDVSADDSTSTTASPATTVETTTTTTATVDTAVLPVTGNGLTMPFAAAGIVLLGSGLAITRTVRRAGTNDWKIDDSQR